MYDLSLQNITRLKYSHIADNIHVMAMKLKHVCCLILQVVEWCILQTLDTLQICILHQEFKMTRSRLPCRTKNMDIA